MTAKESKVVRDGALAEIEKVLEIEGFKMVGRTKEGVAFESEDGEDSLVVRVIVKAEGTDIHALVAEQTAKMKAAEDKAKAAEEDKEKE